jgi:hypothetical protein
VLADEGRDLSRGQQVREMAADKLMLGEHLAELGPGAGVVGRGIDAGLEDAHASPGD